MSFYGKKQPATAEAAYPPPPPPSTFVAPPPPMGYPTRDGSSHPQNNNLPVETKSKGDGFLKGCCAALCCCCLLDACF